MYLPNLPALNNTALYHTSGKSDQESKDRAILAWTGLGHVISKAGQALS